MSSEYTPASGNRPPRRGGRRPGRPRGGPRNRQEAPVQPKKVTLWQKIAAFFSGMSAGESPAKPVERQAPVNGDSPEPKHPARSTGFRKPEIVEVSSPRIYVGNLSFDATEGDLFELFNGVGSVQNVEIVSNKHTQRSKGFAFVQMQSIDEAKRAVAELHDKDYMGRKLVVSGAKALEEKRGERRQPE
ncbi:MAG TPA: RNA-binding protein [Terrimicrobiaceae bacterium]